MLYRGSKSFDILCSTFIIYSISEKNWGHEGRVTCLEILHPCDSCLLRRKESNQTNKQNFEFINPLQAFFGPQNVFYFLHPDAAYAKVHFRLDFYM